MQTGFESGFAHFIVETVRRSDRDGFDSVRTLSFFREHFLVIRVAAVRINAEADTEIFTAFRVDIKCTGNELERTVTQCRRAMNVADLAAAAAADHAPTNRMV